MFSARPLPVKTTSTPLVWVCKILLEKNLIQQSLIEKISVTRKYFDFL